VIISLNSVNQLIFVMVKFCVYFAVRTRFLYIIKTSFGFKELINGNEERGTQLRIVIVEYENIAFLYRILSQE
jgi:hypothetical protein